MQQHPPQQQMQQQRAAPPAQKPKKKEAAPKAPPAPKATPVGAPPLRNPAAPWSKSGNAAEKTMADIQQEQEMERKSGKSSGGFPKPSATDQKKKKEERKPKGQRAGKENESLEKDKSHNDPYPRGCFWHMAGKFPRIEQKPECMSFSEIVNIFKMQMYPLRTNDVRRDDYYFDEALARQRARLVAGMEPLPLGACEGMGEGLAVVPGLGGRPGGSASKALSASGKEAVRTLRLKEKARSWQNSSNALGRFQKSSVRRPRELMDLSKGGAAAAGDKANSNDVVQASQKVAKGVIAKAAECLVAPRWSIRASIDAGFDSVLRLEDLTLALEQGTVTAAPSLDKKIVGHSPVMPTREALLGDRSKALATLARVLCLASADTKRPGAWTMDAARLTDMAKVAKARKMLCRALRWIDQGQSRAFLLGALGKMKDLCARGNPEAVAQAKTLRESKQLWWESMLDERLSQALVGCTAAAIGNGGNVDPTVPVAALKAFLDAYNDKAAVRGLMETRGVSMVVQAIAMHGQQLSACCGNPQVQGAWMEQYNRFVSTMAA
jgi:hypothetical protein